MTSNKYRRANENIRLSEDQKQAMRDAIMRADLSTVQRRPPFLRYAFPVFAGAFALLLILVMPRTKPSAVQENAAAGESINETVNETMSEPVSEAAGTVTDYEAVPEEAAEVLSAGELSRQIGCEVADFDEFPGARQVEYMRTGAMSGAVRIMTEDAEFVVLVGPGGDSAAAESYSIREEEGENAVVFYEDDAVRYSLLAKDEPSAALLEELKGFVRR